FVYDAGGEEIWICRRGRREFVETGQVFFADLKIGGAEIVFELREFVGTEKNRSDEWFSEYPCEGDLRGRRGVSGSDLTQTVDQPVAFLLIVRKHVETHEAAAIAFRIFATVLPAEEAAGKRTPDQNTDARVLNKR